MFFHQTGKQDDAGRFKRGYLQVPTGNPLGRDLPGGEKAAEIQLIETPITRYRLKNVFLSESTFIRL